MTPIVLSYASDARWPIVRIRWPAHRVSTASLERTYAELARMLERGVHVVLVTFEDGTPYFDASQRRFIANFITNQQAVLSRNCRGLAIVSSEAGARGLVTALDWQSKAPFERAIFEHFPEAARWLAHRWDLFEGGTLDFARAG
jgi:hypothetical protein